MCVGCRLHDSRGVCACARAWERSVRRAERVRRPSLVGGQVSVGFASAVMRTAGEKKKKKKKSGIKKQTWFSACENEYADVACTTARVDIVTRTTVSPIVTTTYPKRGRVSLPHGTGAGFRNVMAPPHPHRVFNHTCPTSVRETRCDYDSSLRKRNILFENCP